MTENEERLRKFEIEVRLHQLAVEEARMEMERGYVRLSAEFERDYARLKNAFNRECLKLEQSQVYLEKLRADAEKGFRE